MWCKNCNIETNEEKCPICREETFEDYPTEVYWCDDCRVPVMQEVNQADKGICPRCGKSMKYLVADIRPVFPEERLLIEILLKKEPHHWINESVWASNNRYYINGKSVTLPSKLFKEANADKYIELLENNKEDNSYDAFFRYIEAFVEANRTRIDYLIDESHSFIKKTATRFPEENIVISFSGGKDSTVTADLVIKALSDPSLVHIFGNTTLEFPLTIEYAKRYRKNHPHSIFKIAENRDQVFKDVCEDIGPPARMMRWCCSMFKTGPITRVINSLYRNQRILTFYGIRKSESVSRSKYNRIEDDAESVKIQQQTVASPIFFWKDMDIWLYILAEKIDFNDAYRLGYDRVGCWCCPNNNQRAQFLSRIFMPEQSKAWRNFLIDFARKIGKPDAEEYVDSGAWKARQGGNGLATAGDVKIRFTNCTTEDHAKIYRLVRPMDDEFLNLLTPFGRVAPELGQKLLQEQVYRKDYSNRVKGDNTVFDIAVKDSSGNTSYVKKSQCEAEVKSILPKELSRYFFFDGERIEKMSKDISTGKKATDFAEAVKGLLGLNAMISAIGHFNPRSSFSVIGSYEKSFDSKSNNKIQEYSAKIDKCNVRLSEIDAAIEELDAQKAAAETRKSEKVIELKQYSEGEKLQKEKHALRVDQLTGVFDELSKAKLIDRNVDVYANAPLIGFLYGRTADIDDLKNPETGQVYNQNVMGDRVMYSSEELTYNFWLIMLLDANYEPDEEKRIDKAFRHLGQDPADEERFDSYVRGGIDVLYEKLVEGESAPEAFAIRLYEFIDEFNDRFNSEISSDDILQLCVKKS